MAPVEVCDKVVSAIRSAPAGANVAVVSGAVSDGGGDLILFDVAREAANPVFDTLRGLGVVEAGSISITESGGSGAFVTGCPFNFEPFVDPRSFTWPRLPSHRISMCCRLVPVSSTVMSASEPRPMIVRDFVIG